ncbi:MAG: cysteine hydrolase family protein [Dongiaceae bacterium]
MAGDSKQALLLIDIQQAMFGPDEICHQPERMLANAGNLLSRARAAGVPVFFVQHCEEEGAPLAHKSAGWQIHPKVAPRAGEPVTEKWASSSFYKTDLDERLRAAGIGRLVIAGLQSEFCIDTACRVAQSLGYAVTLAADAHSTFDNSVLNAEKIIQHHNRVLSGIVENVTPTAEITF